MCLLLWAAEYVIWDQWSGGRMDHRRRRHHREARQCMSLGEVSLVLWKAFYLHVPKLEESGS